MTMASRRKRALTIPLTKPALIIWRRQKSVNQTQSILFRKLPLEVRELIYEHTSYFPDQSGPNSNHKGLDIHIFRHSGKLRWRRCSSVDSSCTPHCYRKFYNYSPVSLNLLAVVLTCRQIYSEAINLLYSRNTFVFINLAAITSFTSTVLPQRLDCIRSIRLKWVFRDYDIDYPYGTGAAYSGFVDRPFDKRWSALWKILARMDGLRTLHVRLEGHFRNKPTWEDQIFAPMRLVEGLQDFRVEANWMAKASSIGPFQFNVCERSVEESVWKD